jgi:hypothetical protein
VKFATNIRVGKPKGWGNRVTETKNVVTVQSVVRANGRLIAAAKGSAPAPVPPLPRVAAALRDVAAGGRHAMQTIKKS